LEKEVVIKKGTKVKMLTEKNGKVVVEKVTLKSDKTGILLQCENGIYALLLNCGNLVIISEKPKIKKKYEPIYIEKPVYIERPVYVPPPAIHAPPPPPIRHFYFHYHYRSHP